MRFSKVAAMGVPLALSLAACATRSPEERRALAGLDPRTLDPTALRLAAVLPEGLEPQPEGMVIVVSRETTGAPGGVEQRFVLQRSAAAEDQPPAPQSGFRAFAFRFGNGDIARFRVWRQELDEAIAAGQARGLKIRARAQYCRLADQPERIEVTVLARANASESYGAILKQGDQLNNATATGREQVPPCGKAAPRAG